MEVFYRNDSGGHVAGDLVRVADGPVAACVLQPGGIVTSPTGLNPPGEAGTRTASARVATVVP